MAALRKLASILASASFAALPASAADKPQPFNAGDYIAPFFLVCLQSYGDAAKQLATAKAMYKQTKAGFWKLVSETKVGITTKLSFEGGVLSVDEGGNSRCSLASYVDQPVTLDDFGAGVSAAIGGVSPTKRVGPPQEIVWILELPNIRKPLVLSATTSAEANRNIVTLAIQDF